MYFSIFMSGCIVSIESILCMFLICAAEARHKS